MSGTRTSAGSGIGVWIFVGVVLLTAGIVASRQTSDTELPPDPFEGEEPREVDCVADWQSPRNPIITADIYCEVGGPDNSFDAQSIERSPYVWSTTGNTGQVAVIEAVFSRETAGSCQVWVDGEFLDDEPIARIVDEGQAPDGGDVVIYTCALEVAIP